MDIRVFTAFSGYDSQLMALERLRQKHNDFNYECIGWSDIDDYAIKAHDLCFPYLSDKNYGDISKIDWDNVPDFDLFTYSFPCTDISSAGLKRGLEEGSGTRSSLLWECRKAILQKKPKFLVMENVKSLVDKKNKPSFDNWIRFLDEEGYNSYYKVLNAKDYAGIPQNRERIFCVSILKDVDKNGYLFPEKIPLKKTIIGDIIDKDAMNVHYFGKKGVDYEILNERSISFRGWTYNEGEGLYAYDSPRFRKGGLPGLSRTLKKSPDNFYIYRMDDGELGIRQFTPKECFRLMDVPEKYISIMCDSVDDNNKSILKKTALLGLAGNSIVVGVIERIMEQIFFGQNS